MKRVLLVAYFFPPDGGAGTQRAVKFCKYLPEFGWQPTVITRAREAGGQLVPEDAALLADVGPEVRVVRVPEGAPGEWACDVPDIDIGRGWLEPAWQAIRTELLHERPDAVLITMSPFSLAFLGQRVQKQFGVPVIYDLRDPWALDGWRLHGTRRRARRDRAVMRETLTGADGVIANTAEAAAAFRVLVPGLSPRRLTTIPNGYDAEDFAALDVTGRTDPDEFRLVHTGTLHSRVLYAYRGPVGWLRRLRHVRPEPIRPAGRTPYYLLRAMHRLRRRGHPLARRLRLVLVGPGDAATRRCVAESGVQDQVLLTGYVTHPQSVAHVQQADALFLPLHGAPRGRRSLIVPGKTYEYLATGKPILACLPPGDARELVARSGRAFCADPCDADDIARALGALFEAGPSATMARPSEPWLAAFERRTLTGRLAAFLQSFAAVGAAPDAAAVTAGRCERGQP